jgi:hypothetical protein
MYTYVTIISICNLNKSLTVVINIQNGGIISVSLQLFEVLTYHFFYDLTISCHIISLEWREVRWWFWLFFDVSCFLSYLVNRKLIHCSAQTFYNEIMFHTVVASSRICIQGEDIYYKKFIFCVLVWHLISNDGFKIFRL